MTYFNEIPESIKQTGNKYEEQRGIRTLTVNKIAGSEEELWAIFEAKKSDNTYTLFFAYKHKRASPASWYWVCPAKEHIKGFHEFIQVYWGNEDRNDSVRGNPKKPLDIRIGFINNSPKLSDFLKKR